MLDGKNVLPPTLCPIYQSCYSTSAFVCPQGAHLRSLCTFHPFSTHKNHIWWVEVSPIIPLWPILTPGATWGAIPFILTLFVLLRGLFESLFLLVIHGHLFSQCPKLFLGSSLWHSGDGSSDNRSTTINKLRLSLSTETIFLSFFSSPFCIFSLACVVLSHLFQIFDI